MTFPDITAPFGATMITLFALAGLGITIVASVILAYFVFTAPDIKPETDEKN